MLDRLKAADDPPELLARAGVGDRLGDHGVRRPHRVGGEQHPARRDQHAGSVASIVAERLGCDTVQAQLADGAGEVDGG